MSQPRAGSSDAIRTSSVSVRRWALAALCAAGALVMAVVADRHQAIGDWIFLRYLRAVLFAAIFSGACIAAGHGVVVRTLRRVLPMDEHLAIASAIGVFVFFLTSFLFGLAGLYGLPFFVLAPVLLLLVGGRPFLRTAARLRRHAHRFEARLALGPLRASILLFGCIGVLLVWFPTLTPQNASYDARWYHLPLAEHYVAAGRIAPFREGYVVGAAPHLASLLYAWALSAPGSLFDRIETAAQIEFAIFLMTLVGVVATVRKTLGARSPLAWVAVFLFPGIFCYDSGLVLGADHVAALWAAPIFLLAVRFVETPSNRYGCLLGAVIAGALETKYTAVILFPLPVAMTAWLLATCARRRAAMPWKEVGCCVIAAVGLTTPWWLKNAIDYGDPFFPLLRHWLPAHPWLPAAEAPYQAWFTLRSPALSPSALVEMAKTLATFSFVPHDFPEYHGERPLFGSLFTLLTPILFFVRRRRLDWLFVGSYLGVATWFFLHHYDRYLQALVPWMASATAVALIHLWQQGGAPRAASAILVALQIVWASDVPFLPAHRASASAILAKTAEFLGQNDPKEHGDRLTAYPEWEAIGRALPRDAKVLVHEELIHLGLGAESVLDYPGYQGALYWGERGASTPAELWRILRAHGVSHLVWADKIDHATDTVAGAFALFDFATHHTRRLGTYGGFALAALADAPPASDATGDVAYYPCDDDPLFSPGLYPLEAMARAPGDQRPAAAPTPTGSTTEAIGRARYLLYDARCHGPLPEEVRRAFELLAARGHAMLLMRRAAP
jgi:hypothetical protein